MSQGILSTALAAELDLEEADDQDLSPAELSRSIERAASGVLLGPHSKRMIEHCIVETLVPPRKFGILPSRRPERMYEARVFYRPISWGQTGRTYLAILGDAHVYCSGVRL